MRLVVIGAGRIGASHAASLSRVEGVSDLVLADAMVDRAAQVAARLPRARAMSVDDAFAAHPDGVVITTPTPSHAVLVRRAVRGGIPAFCEKPLAADLADTVRLARELADIDVPVQVGFQRRFDAGYAGLRAAVADGEIGELRRAHLVSCDARPPADDFVRSSGGIYRDLHIHDLDAVRWVTGRDVVMVQAVGVAHGPGAFAEIDDVDESAAILTLSGGVIATMQGSRWNGHGYDARMEVAGTERTMSAGLGQRAPLAPAERASEGVGPARGAAQGPWRDFAERFAQAFAAELRCFVEVAAGARPSPCTPLDALEAVIAAEACELSRRSGRPVAVDEIRASVGAPDPSPSGVHHETHPMEEHS